MNKREEDRCTGNIGKFAPHVVTGSVELGHGNWSVEWHGGEATWEADAPDVGPVLLPSGALIYVDNHGDVLEVIGSAALVRVERRL